MGNDNKKDKTCEALLGLLKLKRDKTQMFVRPTVYKYKSDFQRKVLCQVYNITPYPSSLTRNDLGILLNMHPRSVQIWFQNSRQSFKESHDVKSNSGTPKSKEKDVPISLLFQFCIESGNIMNQ